MNKIFLSHSSRDKDFVRPIFDYFGGDKCIYDEMTFEAGMPTLNEILKGIEETDLFVFFISDSSLNSEWVQKEIFFAKKNLENDNKKLSSIFPMIIDPNIDYADERIPDFLREGFQSYNLRHINTPQLACKKIDTQLVRLLFDSSKKYEQKQNFYYGRDIEKKKFKESFDERDENGRIRSIKCLVISGIDGIGRKSYAKAVLKDTELMERYYYPLIVSLSKEDTIDDLILKLCIDFGLGDYGLDTIQSLTQMNNKIELLANILTNAQNYNEKIIIEDDLCIVRYSEMVYWFEKALKLINNKITVIVTTRISLREHRYINNKEIFYIQLQTLTKADTYGFLRGYSKLKGIPFDDDDISFFSDILNGYPPQIQYCVDLALENESVNFVKNNSYLVAEMPTENSAKLLNIIIEDDFKSEYHSFLAMMAQLGTVPITLINQIVKTNSKYKDIYNRIQSFSICSTVGSSGEFIRLNSVIKDYILRNGFELSEEIKDFLNTNISDFASKVDNKEYMNYLSFSEFSYYIKENLKQGNKVPEKFLYSTIYVRTIIELYNSGLRNYQRIIDLVSDIKKTDMIKYCDDNIKNIIQFYYCSSLARLQKTEFDAEVSYFKDNHFSEQYYFLKGFYFRQKGLYKESENNYLKVLDNNPRHEKVRRELVIIYTSMQDYSTAIDLAEQNYNDYPDNLYHMQAYFDCLIYKGQLSESEKKTIKEIISTAESIFRTNSNDIYFQLKAKYIAFIKNNKNEALKVLKEGISYYHTSFYLHKDYFDICKKFQDIKGMETAYSNLEKTLNANNPSSRVALLTRKAYLDAYKGKPKISIEIELKEKSILTENALNNILKNISNILEKG